MQLHPAIFVAAALALTASLSPAAPTLRPGSSVTFQKITLTDQYLCDGITAADIDRDGHVDVIAGPYWYAGPDFRK
jgi:hypothetical protein